MSNHINSENLIDEKKKPQFRVSNDNHHIFSTTEIMNINYDCIIASTNLAEFTKSTI